MGSFGPVFTTLNTTDIIEKDSIQDPVKKATSGKLGPVLTTLEEEKTPIKSVNSKLGPVVANLDDVPDGEENIPEINKVREEPDIHKRQAIVDSEIEKLNEKRKELIKREYIPTDIGGSAVAVEYENKRKAELDEVNKKIAGLRSERVNITRAITPIADNERKDIQESFKFDVTPENKLKTGTMDALVKYGEDKINRVETDMLNSEYDKYDKTQLSRADAAGDPSEYFTWKGIKHGSRPEMAQEATNDIKKIFETAKQNPFYHGFGKPGKFDFNSKAKILQQTAKEYIDKKYEDSTPEFKAKKVIEYAKWLGPTLAFGDEGKGSVEGIKMYSLDALVKLEDRLSEISQIKERLYKMEFNRDENTPIPWESTSEEDAKKQYETFQQYKARIEQKHDLLTRAIDYNKTILKTPEQKGGIRDLGSGLGYNNLKDMITMNISEMQRTLNVADISKKIENNKELSWEEQQIMDQYSMLQTINSMGTRGTWHEVGGGLTYMLPYMASFAISGGAFNVVKTGTEKGITKLAKVAIDTGTRKSLVSATTYHLGNFSKAARILGQSKFSLGDMATKAAGYTVGSAAQTLVLPQYYVKNIAERMVPDVQAVLNEDFTDLVSTLDKNTGDKLSTATWKGGMDAFWEISTERMGRSLMKAAKMPGRAINAAVGKDITKQVLANKFFQVKGFKSIQEGTDYVKRKVLGWDGIREEYFEELASQLGSMATSGDTPESIGSFIHDQFTTFLTVATFGGGMSLASEAVKLGKYGYVGDNVLYYSKKKGEKKEKIYIPEPVHNKLLRIFNDYDNIDEVGLERLFTEYATQKDPKKNLSERQMEFIMNLALQEGEKKHERNLVIKALKKSGVPLKEVLGENPDASELGDNEALSAEDINKIRDKNMKMKESYPDLYAQDLLERDETTGQLMPPTIDYLESLRNQLNIEKENASKRSSDGTFELHDKEKIKENNQKISNLKDLLKTAINENQKGDILNQIDRLETENAMTQRTLPFEVMELNRKISDVETELNRLVENEDIGFSAELPSVKNKILMDEIRHGKQLSGTIDLVSNVKMAVTLSDGRQVSAFIGPHEGLNETKEQYKDRMTRAIATWQDKKEVTLKIIPKEEWNPDDKAFETYTDNRGISHKIPYGDKLDVISEGKTIASIQIHDYDEKKILDAKYKQAKEMVLARLGELVEKGVEKIGGVSHIVSMNDGQKVDYIKDIVNGLVTMLDIKVNRAIEWLKKIISESDFSDKDKKDLNSLIDLNEANIMRHVTSARLVAQGKAKKVVPLDLQSIVFENSESVAMSGADKINANLRTFGPFWKSIAEETGETLDNIQRSFYHISKLNIDNVRNDETFRAFLTAQRTGDRLHDAILSRFMSVPWKTAISFFNFYSNTKLTPQYGLYYTRKKGLELKLLNPAESYGDYVNRFNDMLRIADPGKLRVRLKDYAAKVNKDFTMYKTLSKEDRYELKKKQFDDDLQLLNEITGISVDTWRSYFTDQTKETYQLFEKGNKALKNFKSMENLFREEPLRIINGEYVPYRQSNLMVSLLFGMNKKINEKIMAGVSQNDAFMEAFVNFFTKGSGSVMPNLYKLSTAQKDSDNIGMSGKDVKDDLFSSLMQYNDIINTGENILSSTVSNPIVAHYKSIGKPIEIVHLNGIHNLAKNRYKKGTSAINMSMEDLWITMMSLFRNGGETYLHNLGQFKDKPTIHMIEVPKVKAPSPAQIKELDRTFGLNAFNDAVNYLLDEIVLFNQDLFPTGKETEDMVRAFVYNYAMNTSYSNQIFFGEYTKESYPKGILSLVKRAGSSNSPGYRLNRFTEGGIGTSFRFAIADDKAFLDAGNNKLTKEAFDGMIFMSGDIAKRIQVSMGSVYSKDSEYPVLDSVKAVISYKDSQTNLRGLTKPNIINVDIAAETTSPTYIAIQQYMKKNKIDVLSFTSSSKIIANETVIKLFNEDGTVNLNAEARTGVHVTNMDTNNFYVQQDLRHSIIPKSTKMPAPFLANMMNLPNGNAIAGLISEMQRLGISNLERELERGDLDKAKKKWLKENVNEHSQPELKRLLEAGLTVDDPTYRKMMQTILTAAITKRALEIPINRVTTQEIPDVDGILEPYRLTKDKKHTLLAEVITGLEGGREHDYTYKGKIKEAIQHVKDNPSLYADMFDLAGNLMEWEISEGNGVIPGEVIILSRVPAHGLVSHHVARLKKNMPVNFTMINKKSQLASGSDSDGDQRYNQVFYKNKDNSIFFEDETSKVQGYSEEALANRIMMLVVEDYIKPENFDAIDRPIFKDAYNKTVDRLRKDKETFLPNDPRAYEESRLNNIVGVLMKGILTDHNTIYSIISRYNMFFKSKKMMTFDVEDTETEGEFVTKNIRLDSIAKDAYGAIKAHIGNFQNLAFDNSEDPKIEILGYNEITANMYTMALIGDSRNSSVHFRTYEEHYEYIKSAIDRQSDYFTSPLLKSFIYRVRRNNGGMRNEEVKIVFDMLKTAAKHGKWTEQDVKDLKALYYASNELSDFGHLYSLTQNAPKTYAEYLIAQDLVDRVKNNEMKILDTKSLFRTVNGRADWVTELAAIDKVMEICREQIFEDIIEATPVGLRIRDYILMKMQENDRKKKKLTKAELEAIFTGMNAVFNIRMLHNNRIFSDVNKEVLSRFADLKQLYAGNPFFNFIDIIESDEDSKGNTKTELRVIPVYTQSRIPDNVLQTIRQGFSELPADIQDLFATYTISKFGTSSVNTNGGFYSFLSDKFRIEMSKKASVEMNDWYYDALSPMEQLHIANWIIRINKNDAIKKLAANPTESKVIDYNRDPMTNSDIHRDAMEALSDISEVDQFLAWEKQYDASKSFRVVLTKKYNVPEGKAISISNHLMPSIVQLRSFREQQQTIANKYFPQSEADVDEVQNYTASSIGNALMAHDPNLSNFIFSHLEKMYPGIQIFTNREAFYEFVRRNSNRLHDVNPETLGHAFKNAIFIDPETAVQDVIFHEHAHIYWDALSKNHPIKVAILDLYKDVENPEESAIIDIGRAGTEIGNTFLTGSLYQKFMIYLKDFWRAVKSAFGPLSKTDLVDDLALAIWNNQDNIKPTTAAGDAVIKDMVQYDYSEQAINRDKPANSCSVGGVQIRGVNSMIKAKESIKFDPDERLDERLKRFEAQYKEDTGKNPTPEILFEESQAIQLEWEDKTKAGTAVHAVADEVFSGKPAPSEELNLFANKQVEEALRQSFTRLRSEILKKYPHATFITEQDIISTKYMVFGIADLIVDIGNNKLLVFDFKTTSNQYLNPDGTKSSYYMRSFGLMKQPLNNLHQTKYSSHVLQLSTYAKILEEQENKNNPSEKNIIEGMFIVPVIRHLDDNGKIIFAGVSETVVPEPTEDNMDPDPVLLDNLVPIKYEEKYVDGLLKDHVSRMKTFSVQFDAFKQQLAGSKLPIRIQQEVLSAYSYLTNISDGDLGKITYDALENMQGNSLSGVISSLIELEYTRDDMNIMSFEEMLNLSMHGIMRSKWASERDMMMVPYKVGTNKVKKLNKKRIANTWYHKTFEVDKNPTDHYFYEAGADTLKLGDQVIQIYYVKGARKTYEDYSYCTVTKIDKKKGIVHINDNESGITEIIEGVQKDEGILKVYDGIPLEDRGVTPNNYVPRYVEEEEDIYEKHWNYTFTRKSSEGTAEGVAEERDHMHAQRLLWKWFNEYRTIKSVREFISDQQNVAEIYHNISSLDANVSFNLMDFMRKTAINHYSATQIRIENANGPSTTMPMTLNTYYLLTQGKKAFTDFEGIWRGARWFMPSRMLDGRNTGINFVLMGLDNSLRRVGEEQFDLKNKLDKVINKVNPGDIIREIRGQKYWRMPNLEEFKEEEIVKIKSEKRREEKRMARLLLETIYKHYYTFDPEFIAVKKRDLLQNKKGYGRQVPVSKIFTTKQELVETPGIGRKWASILHELMEPSLFDDIKLETDELDSKGKKKIKTFNEIKEQFALENASKEEIEQWMGKSLYFLGINFSKHMFTGIPILRNHISAGKLYNYYKLARKIYLRGDDNNVMAVERGSRITTLGNRQVRYQTKYLIEAEQKVMESQIFAYFMKRMAAPIDYVKKQYDGNTKASKYLTELTDFLVYKKSDSLGTEFTAFVDFITRLTSLSRISWSPKTNIMNFVIGQSMDIIREPAAWKSGLGRITQNPKKAFAILRRYGLANIVDEARFDELAKAAGLKVRIGSKESIVSYEGAIDLGYIFMEWAEKANQAPIFIGLMSDKEWDAYDSEGKILDQVNALTMNRKIMISDRVKDVHGDYGPSNAAPFWNTNIGKMLFQFKKYYPATIFAEIAPYHLDRNYNVRSGIFATMDMFIRRAKFNYSKDSPQMKRIDKAKERVKAKMKEGKMDDVFIRSTRDYLDMILAAKDSGNIEWGELSASDKRNLWSGIIQMAMFSMATYALYAIKGGDDDKKYLDAQKDWWWTAINRYQSDIFFYTDINNMARQFTNPFAMFNTVAAMAETTMQAIQYPYYAIKDQTWLPDKAIQLKDTPYLKEGEPKILKSLTGWVPAGGAMSWIMQKRMWFYNNQEFFKWMEKQGTDPKMLEGMKKVFTETKTKKQISDEANEYDAIMNAWMLSTMYNNLSEDQLAAYAAMQNYWKEISSQFSDVEKSIMMNEIKTNVMNGDSDKIDKIVDDATKAQKILDRDKHRSLGKKKENLDEAMKLINQK